MENAKVAAARTQGRKRDRRRVVTTRPPAHGQRREHIISAKEAAEHAGDEKTAAYGEHIKSGE